VRIESVDEEFLVTGILEKTNSGEDNFIYLPLASAQRLFGKQGKLTAVSVRLNDVTELDPVKSEIEKLPGAYVIPADEMTEMILEIVGGTRSIMLAIVVIVLVLSGLGVFNTVLMATFERRGEFGYMRCMGARRTHIFRLVLMETLFICAAGLAAGILAGFASSGLIDGWIRSFLAYVPSGRLLRPDPAAVLISAAVLLFMGLAAGVYPGHRASKVSPMEAVRYEQ